MRVADQRHPQSTLPPGKRHGTSEVGKFLPRHLEDGSWTFPRKLLLVYQTTRRERAETVVLIP